MFFVQDEAILQIRSLVQQVNWQIAIDVWSQCFEFPHPIVIPQPGSETKPNNENSSSQKKLNGIPANVTGSESESGQPNNGNLFNRGELNGISEDVIESESVTKSDSAQASTSTSSAKEVETSSDKVPPIVINKRSGRIKNPYLPSFRVTCHRIGDHHSFHSPNAAANFGGAMDNYFGWNVDLKNFDIETVLCIEDDNVRVGMSLTKKSLHRRDIAQFGATTLRPTIAYGMLRLAYLLVSDFLKRCLCIYHYKLSS